MAPVLQLTKLLAARPHIEGPLDLRVRNYDGPTDIDPWLTLRQRAFAEERPPAGAWTAADFRRELLDKPWWQPQRMWLAETLQSNALIGSVSLAFNTRGKRVRPAVHWLAIDPAWRRRGIGRLLMARLEGYCWDAGFREVRLETHAGWRAAVAFYERLGYQRTTQAPQTGS
jgi:GNAT superfamily N-acetyltransferase